MSKLALLNEKTPPPHPLENIGKILAVAAGKGGVGKSTVAVNLALALRLRGYSVGILDADLYGPSLRQMLPEEEPPQQKGELFTPATCFSGIKMISMAHFKRTGAASVVRAPIANGVISQFLRQVAWGSLDFLIIDFPPGTGDIQLTLTQQARLSAAVMVTTPQEISLLDVRKAIDMFQQLNVPIAGIVENMSYLDSPSGEKLTPFGSGGGEKLASEWQVPLLAKLPLDPAICRAADSGLPYIHGNSLELEGVKQFSAAAGLLLKQLNSCKDKAPQQVDLAWKEL